jgi:hypothetical protein
VHGFMREVVEWAERDFAAPIRARG